jgi:hypothetical protein
MNMKKTFESRIRGWFPQEPKLNKHVSNSIRQPQQKNNSFKITKLRVAVSSVLFVFLTLIFVLRLTNAINMPIFLIGGFSLVIIIAVLNYYFKVKRL